MTDEQIKQNAIKAAADFKDWHHPQMSFYDGYIAGAHSRDEEIKELKRKNVEYFQSMEYWQKRARRLYIRRTKQGEQTKELRDELDKLRNPWISVKDRLPEEGQDVLICNWAGRITRNDCISKGDINYMKEHPELYTSWMLIQKPQIKKKIKS